MSLVRVARGRTWGFRLLLDDGSPDPLPDYERVFSGIGDDPAVCRRVGDKVALRFAGPWDVLGDPHGHPEDSQRDHQLMFEIRWVTHVGHARA
jgi:hypothetical protein